MKINSQVKTPEQYLKSLPKERQEDVVFLHNFITKNVPQLKPGVGASMIGYGSYHYRYASGREGEWPVIALAAQKNYISLYVCMSDGKQYIAEKYRKDLPKANIGKSCVRFKKVADIDLKIVKKMLKEAFVIAKKNKYNFVSS